MDGLPLLSGRPPDLQNINEDNCRRCNKDFHFFTRTKKCNHCGYLYCSSCADFQALLPRTGPDMGYESVPVCAYCMEMLSITSSSKNRLRTLPIPKLRAYMKAYNIRASGAAVEKDDLVEAILRSKNGDGCLLSVHENYYRRNSVPQGLSDRSRTRGFFSRPTRDANVPPQFQPQPPYTPRQPSNNYQARQSFGNTASSTGFSRNHNPTPSSASNQSSSNYPASSNRSHNPQPNFQTNFNHQHNHSSHGTERNMYTSASQSNFHSRPPPQTFYSSRPRSATSTAPSSTPASAPAPAPTPAPAPRPPLHVPTLTELLEKEESEITHLPISTLKAILYENRVNIPVGILEKEDLVRKVVALVTDERRDREIRQQEEELEEILRMDQIHIEEAEEDHSHTSVAEEQETSHADEEPAQASSSDNVNLSKQHKSYMVDIPSSHEGLCVVCQDEHANMAIIDCGHLALCKSCSELVMKTSRECPLCRTRIVTEQRLLRIFRS